VVGLLLLVLAVALGFILMLPARVPLLQGQTAIERGRILLLRGDLEGASLAFRRAKELFGEADDRLGNPLTRLAGVVPLLGRTPDAVVAGTSAGALAAEAGMTLADAVEAVPGGPAGLAPRDGAMDVAALERLAVPVGRARALVGQAHRTAARAPTDLVPDLVTEPLAEARGRLEEAQRGLIAADGLLRALPSFLGADEPKRYLLGAQNPAELRGTGGLIGVYSILTIDNGQIEVAPFVDVGTLGHVNPSRIDPPNADYGRLYGRYGAMGDMSNINMTPDFPSAATAIERLYAEVKREPLDGTLLADPEALALLLNASGPLKEPVTGVRLHTGNVVHFVSNEAYSLLPNVDARKRVLGDVAGRVVAGYLSGGARDDSVAAARALFQAGGEGHLLLHAVDPAVQSAFDAAKVSGRLLSPRGDFLAVVVNNASGSKIDFYAERTVRYSVTLLPGGDASAVTEVELYNGAPTEGQPAYVIGPHPFIDAKPGDNTMIVQTYCAPACSIEGGAVDGEARSPVVVSELDHPMAFTGVRVPSSDTTRIGYRWSLPNVWRNGLYRFTFQNQPTIKPTRLEIDVRAPRGMSVIDAAPGMDITGRRVTWDGPATDVVDLWVRVA
jgi:Protein of unknown function (DUF4012)